MFRHLLGTKHGVIERTRDKRVVSGVFVAGLLLLAAACGDDSGTVADARSSPASDEPAPDSGGDEGSGDDGTGSDSGAASEDCEPGPGKTVTPIGDVTIPEVHEPEFEVGDVELAGETILGFVVPEVRIPEQTVEGGCIVEHEAPGGCLGAVEITGAEIPDVEIPGFEIPRVESSDGEVLFEGDKASGDRAEGRTIAGDSQGEVCQQEPADGEGYVTSVYRPPLYRSAGYRATLYRSTAYRSRICVEGECTQAVTVPALSVAGVSVRGVSFPASSLQAYVLEGSDAEVIEEEERTAFLAPADVLFEYDKSELLPDAVSTLQKIASAIESDFPDGATVTVEGHTDGEGGDDYNQKLSEDRAEAVASWLTGEGGLDEDQLTTVGYGETRPVAPNENKDGSDNPEGRAQNRRVVLTVSVN